MRIELELKPHVAEQLDSVVRADMNEEPGDWTRRAVLVNLMLARARQLREGDARAMDASPAPRDEIESVRRERDALRNALESERAVRRRDRKRHAEIRERLRGARNALRRLGESRAACRDLALRVEAALERSSPRKDLGDLEGRLHRALRAAGFAMPRAPDR